MAEEAEPTRFEVREFHEQDVGDGWGVFDTVEDRFTGGWFAQHIPEAARLMAEHLNLHADCPHCGSSTVDRGGTGLDRCESCDGLFRNGLPLARRNR